VREVMLRDIQLPQEYAKGLETLLLKEQENDRMGVETELKQKGVRIAELEAEATKVQQITKPIALTDLTTASLRIRARRCSPPRRRCRNVPN